jgi:hypothetical protein
MLKIFNEKLKFNTNSKIDSKNESYEKPVGNVKVDGNNLIDFSIFNSFNLLTFRRFLMKSLNLKLVQKLMLKMMVMKNQMEM